MILPEDVKQFLIIQAVDMANVYMKEITSSKNSLVIDGPIALEKFYDKLVELWKKDFKKSNERI